MRWGGGQYVTVDGMRKTPELYADSSGSLVVSVNISPQSMAIDIGPIGFNCGESCFGRSTLARGIKEVNCRKNDTLATCVYTPDDNGCDEDAGIICSKCELGRGHMKYCLMTHAQAIT